MIKQALAGWVDLEEERHRMTLRALADVDAGRLIDHCGTHARSAPSGRRRTEDAGALASEPPAPA